MARPVRRVDRRRRDATRAVLMRLVLIGDGESPHLLKWARALALEGDVELWAVSSRGFAPGFDACVSRERQLALGTQPAHAGGNVAVLRRLPRLATWLQRIDADWLHAHYLTSHGTLAWLAKCGWHLRARIVGSAWGSDVLVAPQRRFVHRWVLRRVLRASTLTTSDSQHMAQRMRELGACDVMVFPFGLDAMPEAPTAKEPWLFFANRGLEPIYRPLQVLRWFARIARSEGSARLVVANRGSLQSGLVDAAVALGLSVGTLAAGAQVEFTGLLDATTQAYWYARAQWYVSLPASDSVSVSVLEAMANGCIPVVSDLPANRELVRDRDNGVIVPIEDDGTDVGVLAQLLAQAQRIGSVNRAWVERHGLFPPAVRAFVARLRERHAA
jgi:glycosyltransferase involved in cell wall biosynthesis